MLEKKTYAFIFLLICYFSGKSGILPEENSTLNYTTVYFEENLQPGAETYELLLYSDSSQGFYHLDPVRKRSKLPAFWISALAWGTKYHWKITAYNKLEGVISEKQHVFSIMTIPSGFNNIDLIRLDIKTNKEDKHAGGLILLDYARSMFDRRGNVVWVLPDIPGSVDMHTQIRDIKMTEEHTITFLTEKTALEIDKDARVVWKAPDPFVFGKDTVQYHHEFRKTGRGTYMVLGNRKVSRPLPGNYTEKDIQDESDTYMAGKKAYKRIPMTLLLEFNRQGKLIWFWDANDYITDADLAYKKHTNNFPTFATHSNAFSENEDGTKVYLGFRDLSRIVKIDKTSKKVELSYGEKYPSGDGQIANHLFRRQHDATVTKRNSILIFNNNKPPQKPGEHVTSGIIELKDNIAKNDSAAVWSFDIDFDTLTPDWSAGGGNVVELPDTHLLLCAGILNRIFEVTRNKEVVWDALVLCYSNKDGAWKPFSQYRCNWTPKLYGHHFIPYLVSSARQTSNETEIKLVIANTGNTKDLYEIEVITDDKKSLYKQLTKVVQPNESQEQNLILKIPKSAKSVAIKVSSKNGAGVRVLGFK